MAEKSGAPLIGIIGGGFTGATVAWHLARRLGADTQTEALRAPITVFEPRHRLGAGLAYDTAEPVHRINVPAARMTIDPDDPDGFSRWLAETGALEGDPEAIEGEALVYPRRALFGHYVAAELGPYLLRGQVVHKKARVTAVTRGTEGWFVTGDDGSITRLDLLVLAVSHPQPNLPAALTPLAGHPKLVADPTRPDALAAIDADDRVLVIGNGLTAADVIATLKRRGHGGPVTAISRRGLRARGHASVMQEPFGEFRTPSLRSASMLLRRVRAAIEAARCAGITWHAVIDAVRAQGQAIWRDLPLAERRRIVRHLRPYWDAHRFRIAPQVERVLDAGIADGSLKMRAAHILSAEREGDKIWLTVRARGAQTPETLEAEATIVTTGPAHGGILGSQPFLAGLAVDGWLSPCPTGLGIWNDWGGRALTREGAPIETLYIAGPLARGTFGELMGLPQVTEHAAFIAAAVEARAAGHS